MGRRSEIGVSACLKSTGDKKLTLVNVWQDTTLGNCDVSEKLVQFLIISDGELEMARNDTGLLVVTGGVTSQLEDFGGEVLEDSSEIDRSTWKWRVSIMKRDAFKNRDPLTSTNTLSVVTLSQKTMDTTNWECETGLG